MQCPVYDLFSPKEPEYSVFCSSFSLDWSRKEDPADTIEDELAVSDSKGARWYCNKSCYYTGTFYPLRKGILF